MTAVVLAAPGPVFVDPNIQSVQSNATVTASGSLVFTGYGASEVSLFINVKASPTGTSPTLQYTIQEVDPGDGTTVIGTTVTSTVINSISIQRISLLSTYGGSIKVSWTIGGSASPTFTQVYTTLAAKIATSQITDGVNGVAAIKAASTAAVATDPALVVAISPNNPISVSGVADLTSTGALGALNATVQIATSGLQTVGFQLAAGTLVGTIVAETSFDGGTTWNSTYLDTPASGKVASIVFGVANTATAATIIGVGGTGLSRIRVSAYISGTANITLRAAMIQDPSIIFAGPTGLVAPPATAQIGGSDGTNLRTIYADANGSQRYIITTPNGPSALGGALNLFANLNPYGTLRVSTESTNLFNDPFDGGTIDVTDRWTLTQTSGTPTTQGSGELTLTSTTAANYYAKITSKPSFVSAGTTFTVVGMAVKLDATTNIYRFWGIGTAPGAPTAAAPLTDAIGFELTTAGALNAVVYAAGAVVYRSSALTAPGTSYNRFAIFVRADIAYFYYGGTEVPVALTSFTPPNTATLPLLFQQVNNTTVPSGTPVMKVTAVGVGDTGKNSTQISDGAIPSRKVTVKAGSTAPVAADSAMVVSRSPNDRTTALDGGSSTGILYTPIAGPLDSGGIGSVQLTSAHGLKVTPFGQQQTLQTAATLTVTGVYGQVTVYGSAATLEIKVAGPVTGAGATLTYFLREYNADVTTFYQSASVVITAAGTYRIALNNIRVGVVEVDWTVSGSTPSFGGVTTTLFQVPSAVVNGTGLLGVAAPNEAYLIGGLDNSGNLQAIRVKAASTAAAATDPAVVVALSPNRSDLTASGAITASQNVAVNTQGCSTVAIQTLGTWTGTLLVEGTIDGGTTWLSVPVFSNTYTNASIAGTSLSTTPGNYQVNCAGYGQIRVRGNTVASGTANITLEAGNGPGVVLAYAQQGAAAATTAAWPIKITDAAGANVGAVKAANTAPASTDPAQVVSISPNSIAHTDKAVYAPAVDVGVPMMGIDGAATMRIARLSEDSARMVTSAQLLWHDGFEATFNPWWTQSLTTMTIVQTTGVMTLNNSGITTLNTDAIITSARKFPKYPRQPLFCRFRANITANVAGNHTLVELGIGAPVGVTAVFTDGAFFRWRVDGTLAAVLVYNGTEKVTQVLAQGVISTTSYYFYDIIIDDDFVRFIVSDSAGTAVVDTQVTATLTNPAQWTVSHQSSFARVYVDATGGGTIVKLLISQHMVQLLDALNNKPWEHQLAGTGRNAAMNPSSYAQAPQLANAAAPGTVTPSNTTSPITTLGGSYAAAATAASETILSLFGYTIPSPYTFYVRGIRIPRPFVQGAAVVTVPLLEWFVAYNASSTNLSTATGLIRVPLPGLMNTAATAAIGQQFTGDLIDVVFRTPLACLPGTVLHIGYKSITGAATASLVYRGNVFVDGYYE